MPAPADKTRNRRRRLGIWLMVVGVLLVVVVGLFTLPSGSSTPAYVPLSEVTGLIAGKQATAAEIDPSGPTVTVTLASGEQKSAYYPAAYADTLTSNLLAAGVPTTTSSPPSGTADMVVALVASLLPVALFLGFFLWMIKSGALGGGIAAMRGGRGDAVGKVPDVRFADVAGADEAVAEMAELVDFLTNPDRYRALGATPPRGALLVGPSGTGKTLLARAVAGEAGVPFFPIAGSDFVETFVGVGARRVRDLFDAARRAEVAIIFIDEIDAVGRARTGLEAGGDSERDSTLIAMLNEMDGFTETRIIVLAATNRPDVLDPALTRPGRLDRQIAVPLPDRLGRERILSVHMRGKPFADVDVAAVAARTPGFSGADLARVVNDAAIAAARGGAQVITDADLREAVSVTALGRARTSAVVTDADRRITAWHEAGHTLAALLQPAADDPVTVSIIPRGAAGGATWMAGNDNLFLSKSAAHAQLVVSLAGREAERIALDGDYTSGAHSDLEAATRLATAMVCSYGMDGTLSVLDLSSPAGASAAGAEARARIDGLLAGAAAAAADLLTDNRHLLEVVAEALLDRETLHRADLQLLLDGVAPLR